MLPLSTVAVDAHVHLLGVPSTALLAGWASNFAKFARASQRVGVLMLTESAGCHVFDQLRAAGSRFRPTEDAVALTTSAGEWTLVIMAGRQIVTREGLEVLALATDAVPADRRPLKETLDEVRAADGLAVLPWGAGKWLGSRGAKVGAAIGRYPPGELFFGDNGGRPALWRSTHLHRAAAKGFRILPGTDPLPIGGQEARIGRFGFTLPASLPLDKPATALKHLLRDPKVEPTPYGASLPLLEFAAQQIRLRTARRPMAQAA